jgi:hypothetical protein
MTLPSRVKSGAYSRMAPSVTVWMASPLSRPSRRNLHPGRADGPELERVADELRQFLELLEQSLTRLIANGARGQP